MERKYVVALDRGVLPGQSDGGREAVRARFFERLRTPVPLQSVSRASPEEHEEVPTQVGFGIG